ncbi:tRNA 2-thiouridine(34) synthase MnmA [Candidatus Falkowbacteria bacterium]|nr:tRNA 2-thiouridine(34) synthase MnmA [Candidatus Falkowbacteria bacterium]
MSRKVVPIKKIIVGVSGGVDSSVALILLKQQGWQPIAVTLRLPIWKNKCNALCENVCCTKKARVRSKKLCKKLNIPYFVIDARRDFNKKVVDYFIAEYKAGRTPNPCIVCNRELKFKYLFDFAKKHKINFVATGHYAKTKNGQFYLARDRTKDQTYSLGFLKKQWLKNIVFPLANLTKKEIYEIAKKNGFNFYETIKQSQDFCFVSGKALPEFLKTTIGNRTGLFKTLGDETIGKHNSTFLFTVGQRKGINLLHPANGGAGGPWYVVNIDAKKNIVYVSRNPKDSLSKTMQIKNPNWLVDIRFPLRAKVKIRSTHQPALATISKQGRRYIVVFDKKQRAITPGQFAVFYKNKQVLGAARIV